jgi:outer membrane biosynthesis protein TonB
MKQNAVENIALAPVTNEKPEKLKESAQLPVEEKKVPQAVESKPAPEMNKTAETEPELKKPASAPPDKPTGEKATSKTKPKSKKRAVETEEGLMEFKGPGGEIMYGIPEGKFSLSDTTKMLYDRTKKNAQKAFDELEEAE